MNNKTRTKKDDAYVLYQQMCDEIFGVGTVEIKPTISNNVIGTFRYLDDYTEFRENFRKRLIRLKDRFNETKEYSTFLNLVKLVAEQKNWEGAYAELAAYDWMYNDQVMTEFELDKTLPVTESYAGEIGKKETNEDVFLPDYNLYFDVKAFKDTIEDFLKELIKDAIAAALQTSTCNILPEYPYDDDDEIYTKTNRKALCDELINYLKENNMTSGESVFKSQIIQQLSYSIKWGDGVNSVVSEYSPYRHAEDTKHLILKRYIKKIMKNEMFVLVLVNFPWYNGRISSFINADHVYYRSLARRTFCEYIHKNTLMRDIDPRFTGQESVYEVSRHLAGIVFINDNIIKTDDYSCHVFMNPNALNTHSTAIDYLKSLVAQGDSRSLYDDFKYDNY